MTIPGDVSNNLQHSKTFGNVPCSEWNIILVACRLIPWFLKTVPEMGNNPQFGVKTNDTCISNNRLVYLPIFFADITYLTSHVCGGTSSLSGTVRQELPTWKVGETIHLISGLIASPIEAKIWVATIQPSIQPGYFWSSGRGISSDIHEQFGHVEYYFIVFFHMMAQNLGIYQELLPYFDSSKSSR